MSFGTLLKIRGANFSDTRLCIVEPPKIKSVRLLTSELGGVIANPLTFEVGKDGLSTNYFFIELLTNFPIKSVGIEKTSPFDNAYINRTHVSYETLAEDKILFRVDIKDNAAYHQITTKLVVTDERKTRHTYQFTSTYSSYSETVHFIGKLSFHGSQYIDIGLVHNEGQTYMFKLQPFSGFDYTRKNGLLGFETGYGDSFSVYLENKNFVLSNKGVTLPVPLSRLGEDFIVELGETYYIINGDRYSNPSFNTGGFSNYATLHVGNINGTTGQAFNGNLYGLEVFNGTKVVANLRPCFKYIGSVQTYGLQDIARGTFLPIQNL